MAITRLPSLESSVRTEISGLKDRTYGDFLMWAFADPCNDALKGIFAEWLVLRLLGLKSDRRISWANSDIITPSGNRIEVKSSSYWQDWKLYREDGSEADYSRFIIQPDNKVRFSGLISGDATGDEIREKGYKSSLYVFCFQRETDPRQWDALDLGQWEFYLTTIEQMEAHAARSISLKRLKEIHAGPLSADELVMCFDEKGLLEDCREIPALGDDCL